MDLKTVLREIRVSLRLSMNGIVSTSMREKGIDYKLNFGVSLPKIKEIALKYEKNSILADTLWNEDVREMKILATLLQPIEEFSYDKAQIWAKEVRHLEIAELYCVNLLQWVAFANRLVLDWIKRDTGYLSTMGYLLFARLCSINLCFSSTELESILAEAKVILNGDSYRLKPSALLALKRFGRISHKNAEAILALVSDYNENSTAEKQEYFNDLKFEFEYYN